MLRLLAKSIRKDIPTPAPGCAQSDAAGQRVERLGIPYFYNSLSRNNFPVGGEQNADKKGVGRSPSPAKLRLEMRLRKRSGANSPENSCVWR